MSDEQKKAEEAMEELIQNKQARGVDWPTFLAELDLEVAVATKRLDLARSLTDICKVPKPRKRRKDAGKPRMKPVDTQPPQA